MQISNAIKYSGNSKEVNFIVKQENDYAIFIIEDFGVGVPESFIKFIFEPFNRASNVGNIEGTGLGLFIVKKCVDLHGGSINIERKATDGTKVTVKLHI